MSLFLTIRSRCTNFDILWQVNNAVIMADHPMTLICFACEVLTHSLLVKSEGAMLLLYIDGRNERSSSLALDNGNRGILTVLSVCRSLKLCLAFTSQNVAQLY